MLRSLKILESRMHIQHRNSTGTVTSPFHPQMGLMSPKLNLGSGLTTPLSPGLCLAVHEYSVGCPSNHDGHQADRDIRLVILVMALGN